MDVTADIHPVEWKLFVELAVSIHLFQITRGQFLHVLLVVAVVHQIFNFHSHTLLFNATAIGGKCISSSFQSLVVLQGDTWHSVIVILAAYLTHFIKL